MNNPFDYFEEIYCINLDEKIERWEKVKQEFKKIGIEDKVKRFSAVRDEVGGRAIAGSSHLAVIKMAAQKKLKNILIFEDDLIFIKWNEKYMYNAINNLPIDWKVFNIGYSFVGKDAKIKFHHISDNLIKVERGSDVRGNHTYAINHNAYQYFIDNFSTTIAEWKRDNDAKRSYLDLWLANNFDRYCLVPLFSVQDQDVKSQIQIMNFIKNYLIKDRKFRSLKYLFEYSGKHILWRIKSKLS
ncbi:hypothetical protein [Pleurocapsa sp. PCC 7319]|uniref:hypothetical protein n=1 Tax=Pleurocapsa sp. PCC 7319 TaxID=118161 RepID=UPI00034612A3|nr:hypothetical protein [Pleurocapsa sp. PCC 7319]